MSCGGGCRFAMAIVSEMAGQILSGTDVGCVGGGGNLAIPVLCDLEGKHRPVIDHSKKDCK
jgi:hypothetical protein